MTISILGIDIAKSTFQLHGADYSGRAVLKKRLPRHKLVAFVVNLPPCIIVMESCGGANYWARVFQRSGHIVKLISPQFVKPFVKTNKNDANDKLTSGKQGNQAWISQATALLHSPNALTLRFR